ncbi:PAS domain S-box protein [Candidatus Zixiibacteriota bacterium]
MPGSWKHPSSSWTELFNAANDAIFIHDAETGTVLDVNQRTCEMFGYSVKEFMALDVGGFSSGMEGYDQAGAMEKMAEAAGGGENLFEWQCRKKSGEIFWVEVNLKTATLLDRDIVFALVRDITERKITEEALRLSEAKFSRAFFASPDSITISSLATSVMYEVNDGFLQLSGYTREEIIGRSALELELWPDPSDRERMKEALLETGRVRNLELGFRNKAGELRSCLLSVEIIDLHGEPCNLSVARDINEWKQTEEALKRSEDEYRNLVESARDAIFTLSRDGLLLSLNRAFEKITGWSREEWIGKPFIEILHPDDRKQAVELVTSLISGAIPPVSELRILRKSGDYVVGEFASAPQLEDGRPVGILGIARDITYRKNLEDQLRQAQKLESIGTLAGGVAHDFNNILNIVLAHTHLISRSENDPVRISTSLEAITTAGDRGARIVQQLLTFARQAEVKLEPIDINESVAEIRDIMTSTFPKTIRIKVETGVDLPLFLSDSTQIHQVLLNLCVNARDAMLDGGELSIETGTDTGKFVRRRHPEADGDRYLFIDISDTGVGMDRDTRLRIFEPFFTTKDAGQGTGLGLAVVYGIIQDHGGFLSVRSEPGSGTTFRIYLPALPEDYRGEEPTVASKSALPVGGKETILVVEDEEAIRSLLEDLLGENGYTVISTGDGKEAVSIFVERHDSIDLVLTDVGLPGLSGDEIFHAIRKIDPGMRVILASGYLEADLHKELVSEGVMDVVQKPYLFIDLMQRIRQALDTDLI